MVEHEDDYPEPDSVAQDTPPGSPGQMSYFRVQRQALIENTMGDPPEDATPQEVAQHEFNKHIASGMLQAKSMATYLKAMGITTTQPPQVPDLNREEQEPIVPPRNGGVIIVDTYPTAWTGGCDIDGHRRDGPLTPNCYRPRDVKNASRMHEMLQKGIGKNSVLGLPLDTSHKKFSTTLHDWVTDLKKVLEDRGMESCFFMIHEDGQTVTNLLVRYGDATIEAVTEWSQRFLQNADEYDIYNLKMVREVILASFDSAMNKRIRRQVGEEANGLVMFAYTVNYHQSLNSKAVRNIIQQLNKMSILREQNQNFESFGEKIRKYAQMIEAIGQPEDIKMLPLYVIETYQRVQDIPMGQEVNDIHKEVKKGIGVYAKDWERIISYLQKEYTDMVRNNQWQPGFNVTEPYGLNAQSTITQRTAIRDNSDRARGNTFRLTQSNETRKCHNCGKAGHLRANCPNKKKGQNGGGKPKSGGKSFGKKSQNNGNDQQGKGPLVQNRPKKAPTAGQSHVVHTKDGTVYHWCGKCNRWTFGDRAHSTAEHIVGGPQANMAAEDNEDSDSDDSGAMGAFRLASGLSYTAVIPHQDAIQELEEQNCDSDLDDLIQDQDQTDLGLHWQRDTDVVMTELEHNDEVVNTVKQARMQKLPWKTKSK